MAAIVRHRACRRCVVLSAVCALLAGCLQGGTPVVADRSPVFEPDIVRTEPPPRGRPDSRPTRPSPARTEIYNVQRGDTLYSIAWRHGLNHLLLAHANGLQPPFDIFPGQRLRLAEADIAPRRVVQARPPAAPVRAPRSAPVPRAAPEPAPPPPRADKWVWPVSVRPVQEFGRKSKGMDFVLGRDDSRKVRAVAAGEVVYAGNGIGGFERLIIVRHSAALLSAYSFNGATRVREQQTVKAGADLADIKNNGRASQKLHFELRKHGEPINPRSVLR